MSRLNGKRAYVTGATGGIGRATAERFVAEGARVWLSDRGDAVARVVEATGAVGGDVADVADGAAVARSIAAAADALGGLDVLFLNAGTEGRVAPLEETDPAVFRQVLDVNLFGPLYALQAALPHLRRSGNASVIFTASVAGLIGSPGLAPYCTSKHALIGLMRSAAVELGPEGIRVNTVNPGPIDNRMMDSIEHMTAPDAPDAVRAGFTARVPLGRYGRNVEVAALVAFLASDEASYCHGDTCLVDGGFRAA